MNFLKKENLENMGSKAYRLHLMEKANFPVPKFLVIDSDTKFNKEDLEKYINKNFALEDILFSVRSSSSCEDGKTYSFAGQFQSFLNVEKKDLFDKIQECRESLVNINVKEYMSKNSINIKELKMNVIVQIMIDSKFSGIAFSSNPSGLLNEMVIVCGEGTGDKVVEDKTETNTYYFNKTDKIYYYESSGEDICLPNEYIHTITDYLQGISELFNEAVDIEFAIDKEKLWILQARPITTISNEHNISILDNSNIVESYPGITLPLTESFITEAYYNVFKGVVKRSSKDSKLVKAYDKVFQEMVTSNNGRIYYKINNWYKIISLLPLSKKIIPIWQDMMGVSEKELSIGDNISPNFFLRTKININSLYEFFVVPRNMKKLNQEFIELQNYFDQSFKEELNNQELKMLYKKLVNKVMRNWDITLLNDLYGFIFTGLLKTVLKKKSITEDKLIQFIAGMNNIESLKPIRELLKLSLKVKENGKIIELLTECTNDCDYFKIDSMALDLDSRNIYNEIENYREAFGDRSLGELKLENKTFRENPKLLIEKILQFTSEENKLEEYLEKINKENKTELTFSNPLIKFLSRKAMLGIKNREESRLNRSRLYGMARKIFLNIGKNLVSSNQIEKTEDVFYLYVDEIFQLENKDYRALIEKRKETYKMYENLPPYTRLIFSSEPFNKVHRNINNNKTTFNFTELIGTPCSSGVVEGQALVVDTPDFGLNTHNKILITQMTDPGWVFLIANAKGIISEKGSLLSHTAIVSRELKIPSIVGVKNICSIIETGDYISLDGNTGEIKILSKNGDKNEK